MPELDEKNSSGTHRTRLPFTADRLKTIRGAIGRVSFSKGAGRNAAHGIGYFNSYFNGNDLMTIGRNVPLFSSSRKRIFNHIFAYVMPGEGLELATHDAGKAKAHRAREC